MLPLTESTHALFNRRLFGQLPFGSGFVNVGRGPHVVQEDLLAAVSSGQLSGAVLDCFVVEPLLEAHPFWDHPRILMTPHVAAPLSPRAAAEVAANLIRRFEAGEALPTVDMEAGYRESDAPSIAPEDGWKNVCEDRYSLQRIPERAPLHSAQFAHINPNCRPWRAPPRYL